MVTINTTGYKYVYKMKRKSQALLITFFYSKAGRIFMSDQEIDIISFHDYLYIIRFLSLKDRESKDS